MDHQFGLALADHTLDTTVELLSALLDSASAARPGIDADAYATDLSLLARDCEVAIADMESLLADALDDSGVMAIPARQVAAA